MRAPLSPHRRWSRRAARPSRFPTTRLAVATSVGVASFLVAWAALAAVVPDSVGPDRVAAALAGAPEEGSGGDDGGKAEAPAGGTAGEKAGSKSPAKQPSSPSKKPGTSPAPSPAPPLPRLPVRAPGPVSDGVGCLDRDFDDPLARAGCLPDRDAPSLWEDPLEVDLWDDDLVDGGAWSPRLTDGAWHGDLLDHLPTEGLPTRTLWRGGDDLVDEHWPSALPMPSRPHEDAVPWEALPFAGNYGGLPIAGPFGGGLPYHADWDPEGFPAWEGVDGAAPTGTLGGLEGLPVLDQGEVPWWRTEGLGVDLP